MKEFYPDIIYNKGKRRNYYMLLILACVLIGGSAAAFFILGQTMIGMIMAMVLVVALVTLPSALINYPVKNKPLLEIGGSRIKIYGKEEYRMSDVLVASVVIDVPQIKGTKEEKLKFLSEIASKRPTEPLTGACDVLVKDEKGKEITKYNIIYDCIGALQALIDSGVKQYRIIYSMKRMSVKAGYKILPVGSDTGDKLSDMSEKDKMMQLL